MTKRTPSYRLHKASGQAVVTIQGRDVYLGKFDSPASHEAYGRTIAAWKAGVPLPSRWNKPVDDGVTIATMVVAYFDALESSGRYTKGGKPTSERALVALAVKPMLRLYGTTLAKHFGPLNLAGVRAELCKRTENPKRRWRSYSGPVRRSTVNTAVGRIVRVFRWAASMQLVPPATWQALMALEPLRRGESNEVQESRRVQPVSIRDVAAVLRKVDKRVGAMIRLQWFSGMRPEEVTQLRLVDIDRSGKVWIYRPQSHKTEHHGRERVVMLGPRCQRVLARFLDGPADAWLFPGRWPGQHLSEGRYRAIISEACAEAGVERWAPNRLRHSAATRARHRDGLEVAGIMLGHSGLDVTQVYAERDMRKATAFALANT